jgi:hypothetical protein
MLDKNILGPTLFAKRNEFCNKTRDQLLAIHGDDDGIRMAACIADAEAIIDHIKSFAEVQSLGLVAPSGTTGGPVTGQTIIK